MVDCAFLDAFIAMTCQFMRQGNKLAVIIHRRSGDSYRYQMTGEGYQKVAEGEVYMKCWDNLCVKISCQDDGLVSCPMKHETSFEQLCNCGLFNCQFIINSRKQDTKVLECTVGSATFPIDWNPSEQELFYLFMFARTLE